MADSALTAGARGGGASAFLVGGQIGFNFRFATSWIAGLEADLHGLVGAGNSSAAIAFSQFPEATSGLGYSGVTVVRSSLDYLGTVRGRFGYLLMPELMLFGTGGLAYGGARNTIVTALSPVHLFGLNAPLGGATASATRFGFTVGGGAEWMVLPNWSVKAEYLYYDLGRLASANIPLNVLYRDGANNIPIHSEWVQTSARLNGHVVRAGLNYHFNLDATAPVVAKY